MGVPHFRAGRPRIPAGGSEMGSTDLSSVRRGISGAGAVDVAGVPRLGLARRGSQRIEANSPEPLVRTAALPEDQLLPLTGVDASTRRRAAAPMLTGGRL